MTYEIDLHRRSMISLKENLDRVLGGWLRRRSVKEILEYVRESVKEEALLWDAIRRTYPESINKSTVGCSATEVYWNEEVTTNPELLPQHQQ